MRKPYIDSCARVRPKSHANSSLRPILTKLIKCFSHKCYIKGVVRIASSPPPRLISSDSSSVRANIPRAVSVDATSLANPKSRTNLSSNQFSGEVQSVRAQSPAKQTYEVDQQVFLAGSIRTVVTSYNNGSMDVYQELKIHSISDDRKFNGTAITKDEYYSKSERGTFVDRLA